MRRAFLAGLFALALGASAAERPPARILFVGNSLTSSTDVPGRLAKLARAMGREAVVESVTVDGYSLEDHWRDGRALEAIRKGGWDVVVLQQGTSAQDGGRALAEWAKRFASAIRAAGAKPALSMTWPAADRPRDFEACIAAWRHAAAESRAALIPAGEAWLRALGEDRRIRLYADGIHPSSLGSDLVVLSTWFTFFPAGPTEFDEAYVAKIARALDLPADRRDLLLDVATRAVDEPLKVR